MRRTASSGTLRKSGEVALSTSAPLGQDGSPFPKIPKHLNVHCLTQKRKLSRSTGNLHGYMAEDYTQLKWPLPKAFGEEKYAYSLIDIEDSRFTKDCAGNSKRLIRLQYDAQIIDFEWRKTYKKLLDAEHRRDTLPKECKEATRNLLKSEVSQHLEKLLELQEQKDAYEHHIKESYSKCDAIKASIKKENDLEELQQEMEREIRKRPGVKALLSKPFNIKSEIHPRPTLGG